MYSLMLKKCTQCGVETDFDERFRLCDHCRTYYRERIAKYRATNPEFYIKEKDSINKKNAALKQRVFNHYGLRCSRCGFDDLRCLHLHHTNGDGKRHRFGYGSTYSYMRIEKEGYPDRIITLCANCHAIEHSI
jgi:hypothetical protein